MIKIVNRHNWVIKIITTVIVCLFLFNEISLGLAPTSRFKLVLDIVKIRGKNKYKIVYNRDQILAREDSFKQNVGFWTLFMLCGKALHRAEEVKRTISEEGLKDFILNNLPEEFTRGHLQDRFDLASLDYNENSNYFTVRYRTSEKSDWLTLRYFILKKGEITHIDAISDSVIMILPQKRKIAMEVVDDGMFKAPALPVQTSDLKLENDQNDPKKERRKEEEATMVEDATNAVSKSSLTRRTFLEVFLGGVVWFLTGCSDEKAVEPKKQEPENDFAKIEQFAMELKYSKKTAQEFTQMARGWTNAHGEPILIELKEKLANTEMLYNQRMISRDEFVLIKINVMKELGTRIMEKIKYENGCFNLDDIVGKHKADCLGYTQIVHLLCRWLGLSNQVIAVQKVDWSDTYGETHVASLVHLTDDSEQAMIVDLAGQYISQPFVLQKELTEKVGIYREAKYEKSPFRVYRKIRILNAKFLISSIYFKRAIRTKNTEEALTLYNICIKLDPENVWLYANRGNIYRTQKKYDKSLSDYTKTIELDPSFGVGYYNRGVVYYDLGNLQQALADFNKAIEVEPTYGPAYVGRGEVYFNLGRLETAKAEIEKGIKIGLKPVFANYARYLLKEIDIEMRNRKSRGFIGKFTEIEPITIGKTNLLSGIIENIDTKERLDLSKIAQRRPSHGEVEKYIKALEGIIDKTLASSPQPEFLKSLTALFRSNLPQHIIITQEVKAGFFGVEKPDLLVINEDILNNPISFLHEIAEYLKHTDLNIISQMENFLDATGLKILEYFKYKYTSPDSEYITKGNISLEKARKFFQQNRTHYIIRAFTKQIFREEDKELSKQIFLEKESVWGRRFTDAVITRAQTLHEEAVAAGEPEEIIDFGIETSWIPRYFIRSAQRNSMCPITSLLSNLEGRLRCLGINNVRCTIAGSAEELNDKLPQSAKDNPKNLILLVGKDRKRGIPPVLNYLLGGEAEQKAFMALVDPTEFNKPEAQVREGKEELNIRILQMLFIALKSRYEERILYKHPHVKIEKTPWPGVIMLIPDAEKVDLEILDKLNKARRASMESA